MYCTANAPESLLTYIHTYIHTHTQVIVYEGTPGVPTHLSHSSHAYIHTYIHTNTQVIVYEGTRGVDCTANAPESLLTGMNKFLTQLEITFRRDPENYRPRINKQDSVKDKEQKSAGTYFYMDE